MSHGAEQDISMAQSQKVSPSLASVKAQVYYLAGSLLNKKPVRRPFLWRRLSSESLGCREFKLSGLNPHLAVTAQRHTKADMLHLQKKSKLLRKPTFQAFWGFVYSSSWKQPNDSWNVNVGWRILIMHSLFTVPIILLDDSSGIVFYHVT